jgi:hypothetical protein
MSSVKKKVLDPVDENVKVPAAVKAAAARSDEIYAQAYPGAAPEAPPEQPAPEAPVQDAAAPATPPPEPPPAPLTTPPPDAEAPRAPVQNGSWEQQYLAMKGRNERNEQKARALSERVSGLEATLAALEAAPPPAAAPTPLVTATETSEYGAEFLDVVGRKAREIVSPEVAELRNTVAQLQQRLDSVGTAVVQDARSRMKAKLSEACPNWIQLNNDDRFLDWLALPDTYSGAIRHELLKSAYAANDTPRVLAFFNGFLADEAASNPRVLAPSPAPEPPPAAPQDRVSLESLAAPGRAKTAAHTVPAEKPSFTRAQVLKFYADVARGVYRGRDDEKATIDKQISMAGREGRIT